MTLQRVDELTTKFLSSLWGKSSLFDAAIIVIARWAPVTMLALIALACSGFLSLTPGNSQVTVHAFAAIGAALLGRAFNEPIARFVARPRPFQNECFVPLVEHESGESFPSNHTTGAFALACGMMHVPAYGVVLLVIAVSLGFSRIYVGLHHVSDVLAGAVHGIFAAGITLFALGIL